MRLEIVVISGGQTGADRAALDWAIKNTIPHGGWCPKGRLALDGPLDPSYRLKETPTEEYLERTEWNVRDSDATVVFTLAEKAIGNSQKTLTFARKQKKPCLHLHKGMLAVSEKLAAFLDKHHVRRINVAGSAEADEPGIYDWLTQSLDKMKMILER